MPNPYGPVPTVFDKVGNSIAAKWLQDDLGNFILNPITLKPYLVPESFNLGTFIDRYAALGEFPGPAARVQIVQEFMSNFPAGGVDDLQRSYNGLIGASPVLDFRPAASFVLGVAGKAAGLPDWSTGRPQI